MRIDEGAKEQKKAPQPEKSQASSTPEKQPPSSARPICQGSSFLRGVNRVATPPDVELSAVSVNGSRLVLDPTVNREPGILLPSLDGPDVPFEIGSYLFPGIQPFVETVFKYRILLIKLRQNFSRPLCWLNLKDNLILTHPVKGVKTRHVPLVVSYLLA